MKKVAGRLRLDLAQYRELEAFAQFGSELDKSTRERLAQGQRIVETLKQPQYKTLPVWHQVVILYSAVNGYLMDIEVNKVREFNEKLVQYISANYPQIFDSIKETKDLTLENEELLKKVIVEFKERFKSSK